MTNLPSHSKIKTLEELVPLVEELRAAGKRIVTTNGCFDIIHPGHVDSFEWAREQGDVLIVGVNSDASVRENKGDLRPIQSEASRARVLAGLGAIDHVFIFDEKSPAKWLPKLRPHVHIKGAGSEREPAFAGEKALVESFSGVMRLSPQTPGHSTTNIIEKILRVYKK